MKIVTQLSIFMENKPGNLSQFCSILEEGKIDIQGMSVIDAVDHAVIRIIVDDSNKCSHLLGDQGIVVIESQVLQIELGRQPGELKKVAQIFTQENINIDYIYGSESEENGKASLFLKVSDPQKAFDVLKKYLSA